MYEKLIQNKSDETSSLPRSSSIGRVLLIEDNPGDARLIRKMLTETGAQFDLSTAETLQEGLDLLLSGTFESVLLDLGLPDSQGLETLEKTLQCLPNLPVVILTGLSDEKSGIEAVHKGAQDYLVKGEVTGRVLIRALKYAVERKQIEMKLRRQQAQLSAMAVLCKVTAAIHKASGTSELIAILDTVLDVITGIEIFSVERKGGIFLVEEDRMRLVSQIGLAENVLACAETGNANQCLCGLAASTGEIVLSKNSETDHRHMVRYPGMQSHGHVIVPIKKADHVLGVMCLYLPADKDIDAEQTNMLHSICNQIGVGIENARLHDEITECALHDPLTGLANRRLMDIVFEKNMAAAHRHARSFSVIMVDIDRFKAYNDAHGHVKGDLLLAQVAKDISREIRETDLLARYGGEEFILLLDEPDTARVCEVAERVRKSVQANTEVTVSLGVAHYWEGINDKYELIAKADKALYRAKNSGRNRVETSDE